MRLSNLADLLRRQVRVDTPVVFLLCGGVVEGGSETHHRFLGHGW